MNVSRAILPVVLVVMSACAPRSGVETPKPLIPKEGPGGSVRVLYDGGVFNRRATASFRVERSAHVIVAHLGGDGVIRVLFPADGRSSGWVIGKRSYRTSVFTGDYDAAPGYFFMRPAMFRTAAARHYSYDGRGHGFVFMITSKNGPLRFDRISDFGLWDEFEVRDYSNTADPRVAIAKFAELLSGGKQHSLEYATSFASHGLYSYAQARMDCAMLSNGMYPQWWSWSEFGSFAWHHASRGLSGCGSSRYAYGSSAWDLWPQSRNDWTRPVTTASAPPQVLPPVNIPAHRIPRPGRRDEASGGSALGLTRPTFAQPIGAGGREWDRRGRESPFGGHIPTSVESARPSTPAPAPAMLAASPPVRPTGALSERPVEVKRDP